MESTTITANGLRFRLLRWGPQPATRPVLLLHGLASNARIWELVAPALAEVGLTCFAPDLRGHGRTDKPEGDYSHDTLAEDVLRLSQALGAERPILIGHSWGAAICLRFAARYPEGPGSPAAIVLVDGGMAQLNAYPGATWETIRDLFAPPRLAGTTLEDFRARLAHPARRWRPDDQANEVILANFEIGVDHTIRPHLTFERHMQIVRAIWDFQTHRQFEDVRCPVLMIPARPPQPWDPQEAAYVALKEQGVARAQATIASLQVHWMDETVHDVPLHRPRELANQILAFVAGLP